MAVAVRGETSTDAELGIMEGYKPESYGNGIADVYDRWYADISDISSTVAHLAAITGSGHALELGIGSGRIAVPLSDAGTSVWGVDASPAMVELLRSWAPLLADRTWLGDMSALGLPPKFPIVFETIFVTFNTFCNVTTKLGQQNCLTRCRELLAPGGRLVVESFVPAEISDVERSVTVKSLELDRVVLTVSIADPVAQSITGQHVEFTESGGVKLRPFVLRYLSPSDLDDMAMAAGLTLHARHEDWTGTPFTANSGVHVSTYVAPYDETYEPL